MRKFYKRKLKGGIPVGKSPSNPIKEIKKCPNWLTEANYWIERGQLLQAVKAVKEGTELPLRICKDIVDAGMGVNLKFNFDTALKKYNDLQESFNNTYL